MSASASAFASASASAHASSSTNAFSPSPSYPPPAASSSSSSNSRLPQHTPSTASQNAPSSTHPSTLPHSPETLRQIAEARTALEASMTNIGSSLSANLSSRAQNLHANNAQLDKQMRDVSSATTALQKSNDKLGKMAGEGEKKMKELGNVQNWAEMLERDFLVLEATLRLAREGSEDSWSGSESGSSWSGSEDGERDVESLEGDRRREGIGKGFGVDDEEMGFLDVYGAEGDNTMEGVETEAEDGEGEKGAMHDGVGEKYETIMVDNGPAYNLDKGKGKEIVPLENTVDHQDIDMAGESSTAATPALTSHPSSQSRPTMTPSASSSA